MKTFTLLFTLATLFAACETVEPPPGGSTQDDDKLYIFDTEINSDMGSEAAGLSCENESYPDSAWTIAVQMRGSQAGLQSVEIIVQEEGYFDYAFVHDWFGTSYTDTIYGTGYFDADTAYLNYQYQPMNDDGSLYGEPHDVEIHSL